MCVCACVLLCYIQNVVGREFDHAQKRKAVVVKYVGSLYRFGRSTSGGYDGGRRVVDGISR